MLVLRHCLSVFAALIAIALPVAVGIHGCEKSSTAVDSGIDSIDDGGGGCDSAPNNWKSQIVSDASSLGDAGGLASFYAVWGASEKQIFAVGTKGKVIFYDGQTWKPQKTPTSVNLTAVWGTSPSDVWAVGHEGTLIHFDGQQWEDRSPPAMVFVTTDGGVPQKDAAVGLRVNLWGVWATNTNTQQPHRTTDLWIVGDKGTVIYFNGTNNTWSNMISITAAGESVKILDQLNAVWGVSASKIYIVGHFGTILVGSTSGLEKQQINPKGTTKDLISVWGRNSGDVYAVGNSGTIVHYRNGSWTEIKGAPKQVLRGVWGASSSTAYVIGWDGTLLRVTGGPSFAKGATFEDFNCVIPSRRLEGIWGTFVDGPMPDSGVVPDGGVPQIPAIWVVGASGMVISGP